MTICLITEQPTHCKVQNCRLKDRCDMLNRISQSDIHEWIEFYQEE